MEIFALALVFSMLLACGTAVTLARRNPPASRRRTEALKADPELTGSVLERLERVERALPAFQLEIEALADKAHDLLSDAEKKRKRAAMHERRANGFVVPEDGPGTLGPEQPKLRALPRSGTRIEPL